MKISEMNVHERTMFRLMQDYMSEVIGGCENTMMDFPEDSEEYQNAKEYLEQGHDNLKRDIYLSVMAECKSGTYASHARFAGKAFLLERIEKRLTKWGY